MLERIRIVLVNTSHPGNIGSTARAMKTMGLNRLVLVSPHSFPNQKAIEMSSHADDILDSAQVVSSLSEALHGCSIAIGTSARSRSIDLPPLMPKACAETLIDTLNTSSSDVAIVFGREDSGLTNEELLHCHYHVCIPSNPEYSSLNLAAAVQVLCYEIRLLAIQSNSDTQNKPHQKDELALIEDVEQFYQHLQLVLTELNFLKKENPMLMPKIKRLFNRTHLEKNEVHILRGILTATLKVIRKNIALNSTTSK